MYYIVYMRTILSKNNIVLFFYLFQEMKLNWASSPGPQPKADTSSKYTIIQLILRFLDALPQQPRLRIFISK